MSKHHGLGNDFLIALADALPANASALARAVCHRTRGVGADGLIFGLPGDSASGVDITMALFNADGGRAEMSGNGIRCLAQAVVRNAGGEQARELRIAADSGIRTVAIEPTGDPGVVRARVDMGPIGAGPVLGGADLAGYLSDHDFAGRCLTADVGNPHLVVEVPDTGRVDVERNGAELSRLVGGINVEFVAGTKGGIEMRVWERGAGVTDACGTGACAAAHAARQWGLAGSQVAVSMPGGEVVVELGDTVVLEGPSEFVATVEYG